MRVPQTFPMKCLDESSPMCRTNTMAGKLLKAPTYASSQLPSHPVQPQSLSGLLHTSTIWSLSGPFTLLTMETLKSDLEGEYLHFYCFSNRICPSRLSIDSPAQCTSTSLHQPVDYHSLCRFLIPWCFFRVQVRQSTEIHSTCYSYFECVMMTA